MEGEEWKLGVAFIKGINMYSARRITKQEMLEILKEIEDENLQILCLFKADNVIFRKKNMHYAEVAVRIERVLGKRFGDVCVTARSFRTLEGILRCLRLEMK
ncbi:DUF1697 domain-containing protein [Archaeoglobus veneficus]|uniref:DUF1697 domain-containing protein n=1 Tax=Archaeoglobus veneficus (strain DSM 11195 / SNP6) TaxID=693661 RepID=F2KS76_ARCVS|nr:DUF1697 domain-containing protein [Archaeoglobus veneficus]AEA48015.1 hypothetical protein Arcve_2022 [Archaeoglobus veneficus SNP6]